ncbi:MAG: BatD family protein [Balneolales bacterium]|nr:BatD family protein [Balneolales bacterium]
MAPILSSFKYRNCRQSGLAFFFPLVILFFLLAADQPRQAYANTVSLQGQDINATASVSSSRLFVGERFILTIEVSGPELPLVQRPVIPEIDGLELLSPVPTATSGFSIVNGVSSATRGFRFTVEATEEGTVSIPSIEIRVGERIFFTEALELRVLSRAQIDKELAADRELFVELELSNSSPFAGEQIIAEIVLYFRSDISVISYQPSASWRTEGFWLERLTDERGPRAETVIIDGVQYRRAVLMRYALFPTRSGQTRLGAYQVNVNIRPTNRFGDTSRFFDGFGRSQRSVQLQSAAAELQPKPLPQPQPAGFTGAVGDFRVTRSVAEPAIIIGEPIELITRFEGQGNIPLIDQPRYTIPDRLEAFTTRENSEVRKSQAGIGGVKEFTEILIGRRTGDLRMEAAPVAWFNPQLQRYETAVLPEIPIQIRRDEEQEFVYVEESRLRVNHASQTRNWAQAGQPEQAPLRLMLVMTLFPLLLVGIAFWAKRFKSRLKDDASFSRRYFASENADRGMQRALEMLDSADERPAVAAAQLRRTILFYLADRLNLEREGKPGIYYGDALKAKTGDGPIVDELLQFLLRAEKLAYAPNTGKDQIRMLAETAVSLLKRLKKKL